MTDETQLGMATRIIRCSEEHEMQFCLSYCETRHECDKEWKSIPERIKKEARKQAEILGRL